MIDASTAPAAKLGIRVRGAEVPRLPADDGSDREIAGALFINPRGFDLHVSHDLAKLGVPSRTAAVADAHHHGPA